jgi:uncharacterized oxidoreductase
LIAGGATGIGFALAKALVEQGNTVIICGRRKEALDAAQRQVLKLHIFRTGTAVKSDRQALFAWRKLNHSATNILVSKAAVINFQNLNHPDGTTRGWWAERYWPNPPCDGYLGHPPGFLIL